jgi:hypothetical protein
VLSYAVSEQYGALLQNRPHFPVSGNSTYVSASSNPFRFKQCCGDETCGAANFVVAPVPGR